MSYLFRSREFEDKEAWIGAIGIIYILILGKVMVRKSNSNLFIKEDD